MLSGVAVLPFSLTDLNAIAAQYADGQEFHIEEMPGGASLRRFFRVQVGGLPSGIAMFFPDALNPEEANAQKAGIQSGRQEWPFLEVRGVLEAARVRVPKLLAEHCQTGWIIVEDLGSMTLAETLLKEPERKLELYQRAVRDLANAQQNLAKLEPDCVISTRRFDQALLNWEMEHFLEWCIDGRNIPVTEAERQEFLAMAKQIAQRISRMPYGFVHRDYQSRNLMVLEQGALGWVDFQDALLGPRVYDLVALLGDSYQTFTHDFIVARLREYCSAMGIERELPEICQEFDLVTVQRKLKDAGRFVFIEHKKGDDSYLKFIEPTLGKLRMAARRLHEDPLMQQLERWLTQVLERNPTAP